MSRAPERAPPATSAEEDYRLTLEWLRDARDREDADDEAAALDLYREALGRIRREDC